MSSQPGPVTTSKALMQLPGSPHFQARYIPASGYGLVTVLTNGGILISIIVRFGIIEAFLRFYYFDADQQRRDALARRCVVFLLCTTTVTAIICTIFAAPLSRVLISRPSAGACS